MARRTSNVMVFPAPTGGLETATSWERMPPDTAVRLSNLFPGDDAIQNRGGTRLHCDTGDATRAYTLFSYADGNSMALLSAHDSGKIYDVTTSTAASLASGYNSSDWSWTPFANSAGYFIIAANDSGLDVPWVYDGTTIAPVVVTGVTDTNLSRVAVYLQRVFYAERASLRLWYAAAGAFQGALTLLDLSSYATKGGAIAAVSTWTRDNGTGGMDDLFVVVTTRGQVLIYNGTDPASLATWTLVGVFDVGLPVAGPNCLVRTGPDLILLCTDGYRPLSDYLALGRSSASESELSRAISGFSKEFVTQLLSNRGWSGVIYPRKNMLIVNVPLSPNAAQHAANLRSGKWCVFNGVNASAWGRLDERIYCAVASGKIYEFDTDDLGDGDTGTSPIQCILQTAFQHPTGMLTIARTTAVSPLLSGPVANYNIGVCVNYELISGAPPGPFVSGAFPTMAVGGSSIMNAPISLFCTMGRAFSVYFSFNRFDGDSDIKIYGFRVNYEPGQML